jgi:hypothetical protein
MDCITQIIAILGLALLLAHTTTAAQIYMYGSTYLDDKCQTHLVFHRSAGDRLDKESIAATCKVWPSIFYSILPPTKSSVALFLYTK